MKITDIGKYTDKYFSRTKEIIKKNGDVQVTYAIFLRKESLCAPFFVDKLLKETTTKSIKVEWLFAEGDFVPALTPICFIQGLFSECSEWETLILQKLGSVCVTAFEAYQLSITLPQVDFLAMDARHCTGPEMAEMMAYAASIGSAKAKKEGAKGFIGNANDATAHFFGLKSGLGTMPHALIGYAGSTLKAAELFHDSFPDLPLTVLVDYFGQEITDSLKVCEHFKSLAQSGLVSIRLDTHGGRFCEGLDKHLSETIIQIRKPDLQESDGNYQNLCGMGVSAAAVFHLRETLDDAGYDKVKIITSSGFNLQKCQAFGQVSAPTNVIGTGSYLPKLWSDTYATADIISYDGRPSVKIGREFLLN